MRDHKIALFKTKEDDFAAELAEKDARLQELDARVFPCCRDLDLCLE